MDQRTLEERKDVLVYTTPAFQQDFEVTGPVSLELFVSSSALDTDFTAKLVDVWPNGFAQNLTEGILRMRYRNNRLSDHHRSSRNQQRVSSRTQTPSGNCQQ
jgi:predicted acyl esterase